MSEPVFKEKEKFAEKKARQKRQRSRIESATNSASPKLELRDRIHPTNTPAQKNWLRGRVLEFSASRVSTRQILVIGEKTRRETTREEIFEPHRAMARYHCSKKKNDQSSEVECISFTLQIPFCSACLLVSLCLRSSHLSLRGELSVSSFRHERETCRETD